LLKSALTIAGADPRDVHNRVFRFHIANFEATANDYEFEDLDSYMRMYVFRHIGKS
jgi:hypothetical protein